MEVKERAEILVGSIAKEKLVAEEKLEAAKPALMEAEAALNTIKPAHIGMIVERRFRSQCSFSFIHPSLSSL